MFSWIVIVSLLSAVCGRQISSRSDVSPNIYKDPRNDEVLQETTDTASSPTNPVGTSSYKIRPKSDSYCQVRLDFIIFSIEQPTSGVCTDGTFTVSNHTNEDVTICGNNAGQHMYLTFNNGEDIDMDIITASSTSTWSIQTTQILCSDTEALAPTSCLQYYQPTAATGTVESFNFNDYDGANVYQIANLDYYVCLDPSETYGRVHWTADNDASDFLVTGSEGNQVTTSSDCDDTDYLFFTSGYVGVDTSFTRVCGGVLPAVNQIPTATSPQITLRVVTNSDETPDSFNNGFQILYTLFNV